MEQKHKSTKIVLGVILVAVVVVTLAGTFAYFVSQTQSEPEKLTVTTGTLALTFSDNNTGITATDLQPGESTTKEFIIENTGSLDVTTNMLWNNLVNTYTKGSLTYILEYSTSESGSWTTLANASGDIPQSSSASDYNLATDITIPAGTTYYYKLTITYNYLSNIDQTQDTNAMLVSNFKLGDKVIEDPVQVTLAALGKTALSGTPTFSSVATTDETSSGLYSMADDYGTSYYYRGAVTDNYVKFAGFYWRIIRVNGDGSLRMIYDGTVAHSNRNGASTFTTTGVDGSTASSDRFILTGQAWNANYNDAKYVGWMFGGSDGSASTSLSEAQTNTTNADIKDKVDSWYSTNLSSYDDYIADAIYCNDRSTPPSGTTWWTDQSSNLGYGTNVTPYGAFSRFITTSGLWNTSNPSPQFTCSQKNDRFTVSDITNGNGALTYKVGLITADEIVAAGGLGGTNNHYYYLSKSSNYWFWLLSPKSFDGSRASVFYVFGGGNLNITYVSNASGAVAPVISLKAEYASQLEGSGTADDPFYIQGAA